MPRHVTRLAAPAQQADIFEDTRTSVAVQLTKGKRVDDGDADLAQNRWWYALRPEVRITRPELVHAYAAASRDRSADDRNGKRIDVKALRIQVNGFSVDLADAPWAKSVFTIEGMQRMNVPTTLTAEQRQLPLTRDEADGWEALLNVFATYCDPLARYVVGYYPILRDLRPKGLPSSMMTVLKGKAQTNACNAVRDAMVSGFGAAVDPVFKDEPHTRAYLEHLAIEVPSDAALHSREARLALSDEMRDYASQIVDKRLWEESPKAGKRAPLTRKQVFDAAATLEAAADDLRAGCPDVPSRADSVRRVDTEFVPVLEALIRSKQDAQNEDEKLYGNEEEFFSESFVSTREALITLIARGHNKTANDAIVMFKARQFGQLKRARYARSSGRSVAIDDNRPLSSEKPVISGSGLLYKRAADWLASHRDELPGGLGSCVDGRDSAEFAVATEIFEHEISDDIREFCDERWETLGGSAIAGDADQFFVNIQAIIEIAVVRSMNDDQQ